MVFDIYSYLETYSRLICFFEATMSVWCLGRTFYIASCDRDWAFRGNSMLKLGLSFMLGIVCCDALAVEGAYKSVQIDPSVRTVLSNQDMATDKSWFRAVVYGPERNPCLTLQKFERNSLKERKICKFVKEGESLEIKNTLHSDLSDLRWKNNVLLLSLKYSPKGSGSTRIHLRCVIEADGKQDALACTL